MKIQIIGHESSCIAPTMKKLINACERIEDGYVLPSKSIAEKAGISYYMVRVFATDSRLAKYRHLHQNARIGNLWGNPKTITALKNQYDEVSDQRSEAGKAGTRSNRSTRRRSTELSECGEKEEAVG